LIEVATIIKERLAAVGIEVVIEALPISSLQQSIKERDYQMLLFGEILSIDPDPLTLWHSSQKRDPGLNLALYENKSADKLLDDARQALNPADRARKYADFQNLVIEDVPAAFLYSPLYIYGLSRHIQGFETHIVSMPSDRFSNISKWYINTKRVFKK
jgi:peptide/nickel transport system substrate-binding protein